MRFVPRSMQLLIWQLRTVISMNNRRLAQVLERPRERKKELTLPLGIFE